MQALGHKVPTSFPHECRKICLVGWLVWPTFPLLAGSHAGLLARGAQSCSCTQESEERGWWKQWGPDNPAFGPPPRESGQGLRETVNFTGLWQQPDGVGRSCLLFWEALGRGPSLLLRLHGERKDLTFTDVLMIIPAKPHSIWDLS